VGEKGLTFIEFRAIYRRRVERGKNTMQPTEKTETIFKFKTLGMARVFAEHADKIWMVILGDDELFWVVTPAHAERLVRGGYELAR
jgi:ribosomal protein L15E